MAMNLRFNMVTLLCLLMASAAWAQVEEEDKGLPGQNITVVSEIKPILADAEKVPLVPSLPPIEPTSEEITYTIPTRMLKVPYEAPEVRPLATRADELPPLKNTYIKAGFGNYLTPYLDVYVNSGRGSLYNNRDNESNLGARIHYMSSNGPLPDQQFSRFKAGVLGDFFINNFALHTFGGYERDAIRFYGYDPETDTLIANQDNSQVYNFIYGGLRINNTEETYYDLTYDGKLQVNYLTDKLGQREINPFLDFTLGKQLDENHMKARLLVDHTTFSADTLKVHRTIVSLRPSYRLQKEGWFADLGLNVGADEKGFYLFPDVHFERELVGKWVVFHAAVTGEVQKNNYKTLSDRNPFLHDTPRLRNSRSLQVKAGIRGAPVRGGSYNIHVSYSNVNMLPLFLIDSVATNRFNTVYDSSTNILNFHIETGYTFGEKLRLLGAVDVFSYDLKNQLEAWHLPTIKSSIMARYQINDKIMVGGDIFIFNKMKAINTEGTVVQLPGVVDINLNATYRVNESFHVFLDVNNIAAANYLRYYQYPTLGLNAIGGLKMIF